MHPRDLLPGLIDRGHPVICNRNELRRDTAGDHAIGMKFRDLFAVIPLDFLQIHIRSDTQNLIGVSLAPVDVAQFDRLISCIGEPENLRNLQQKSAFAFMQHTISLGDMKQPVHDIFQSLQIVLVKPCNAGRIGFKARCILLGQIKQPRHIGLFGLRDIEQIAKSVDLIECDNTVGLGHFRRERDHRDRECCLTARFRICQAGNGSCHAVQKCAAGIDTAFQPLLQCLKNTHTHRVKYFSPNENGLPMRSSTFAKNPALGLLLGMIGVTFFGGTLPFTRLAVADMSPAFVTYGRAVVAAACALILLIAMGRRSILQAEILPLFLAALCLVIGFPLFVALAMQSVPASHGGIVLGILPVTTALCSAFLNGERPGRMFWLLSLAGCGLIVAFAMRDGASGFELGDLWLFFAALSASLGYAISGRLSRIMPGWEVISRGLVLCLPLTLTGSWLTFPASLETISVSAWIGFAYVSLFSMFIAFVFWNAGLALGGVALVGQTQLLQIFVTLAVSRVMLGETVGAEAWAVATVIMFIIFFLKKTR